MSAKAWRPQAATQMCDEQEGKAEEMMVGPKKEIGRGHPTQDAQDEGGSRSIALHCDPTEITSHSCSDLKH